MTEPLDVTVSIVNHENREAVLACLKSLLDDAQRQASLQVIVVDNASEDGSAAAIRNAFPSVELIERERRAGFGASHNLALERARGRHVLLLNDDTTICAGAIDALAGYLDQRPGVAVAAPRVVDRDRNTQPSAWPSPRPALELLGAVTLGRRPRSLAVGSAPRRVGWAMGCALLARRSALLAVGGFDERFFMYSEEVDLASRLADAGLETHWVPAAAVIHEGQVSTGGHDSPARAVEMARSRRTYWRRHYTPPGRLVAQISTSLVFLILAAGSRLRGRDARPFWIQAWGCWADVSLPGLREQAAEWNAARISAAQG